jgi:nitrogen PTS system EIIA component
MKFQDFVCFDAIINELKSKYRNGAIMELITALDKAGKLKGGDCKKIAKATINREKEASTGMGKGVALPHVKDGVVKEVVAAIGQSSGGIDFSSLDKQPVYTVILLVSPLDDPDKHLQAMEYVFKHLQNERFRKFLRQSQRPEQIIDLLKEADEEPFL